MAKGINHSRGAVEARARRSSAKQRRNAEQEITVTPQAKRRPKVTPQAERPAKVTPQPKPPAKVTPQAEPPAKLTPQAKRRAKLISMLWSQTPECGGRPRKKDPDDGSTDKARKNGTFIGNKEFKKASRCSLPTLLSDYQFLLGRVAHIEYQTGGLQLRKPRSYFGDHANMQVTEKIMLGWATAWYLNRQQTETRACAILQGTTLWHVARVLRFLKVRFYVLTNSPPVFATLMDAESIPLMATGGEYRRRINALTGRPAADAFRAFGASHVLLSASGFSDDLVIYQADESEIAVSQAAVRSAAEGGELVVVVDRTKINHRDNWEVCDLKRSQFASLVLITDAEDAELPAPQSFNTKRVRYVRVYPVERPRRGHVVATLEEYETGRRRKRSPADSFNIKEPDTVWEPFGQLFA